MAGDWSHSSCDHSWELCRPEHSSNRSTPSQIVQFLSQTIDWYRQTQQEQHIATEPGDLGFVADNRRMAAQVVRLAFEFARAEEQQQAKPSKANAAVTSTGSVSQYEV